MPTKLRLLLAEDDPDDAELLERELVRGGYDVALHRVDTEPAFRDALDAGGWDLIVSDFLMPRFSGRDAVRIYREYNVDVPFIIVSGTVGEDAAVEAMRNGVRDYLIKGNISRLCSAVTRELRAAENRREARALQAQMQAAQRMESMGRLAGGIAHDFNNLLCVIQSYAGFLRARFEAGDEALDDITAIEDATARAARLTSQLLGFGRRQVQQPVVLDLNTPVRELAQMLPRVIGDDVRIGTALTRDLGLVKADPTQIEQVLMNLTVNARDAMPEGGLITIETANVELEPVDSAEPFDVPPGRYVMLAVTDTGTGMDEETRTKIFEPFFTTKPQGKGTGLGLATTFGIVRQSGGHILVYSELGVGTTFKVYLPRVDAEQPTTVEPGHVVELAGGTETILLVENEDRIRIALGRILESRGYTVLSSPSGKAALELVEQHAAPVHLLLTDVVMPEMSGQRLSQRVRALAPGVKTVFMSGYAVNAVVQQGVIDAGAVFLPKPFSSSMLLAAIRRGLDQPD